VLAASTIGPFRAVIAETVGDAFRVGVQQLALDALPAGDVVIRVAYSAVNYKDALVCIPNGHVARSPRLVPGIELTGEVVASTDPRFAPGQRVLATDFGHTMGVARHGGYSEYARVPGDFVFPIPASLDARQALVLTAAITGVLGLRALEQQGLTPQRGPVLVTGATGGVGSLAVRLLALRGYTVAASTGKPDAADYLKQLGASEILSRQDTSADSPRPLDKERWAGSIDTVGGATLAYLMRTTKKAGAIAAVGVTGGGEFRATVYPLILRGISVLGVDLPSTSQAQRQALWDEVTREPGLVGPAESMITEVELADVAAATQALLAGRTRGRTLVRVGDVHSS
jgi:acrylyl-CoA reductase (NADPH)